MNGAELVAMLKGDASEAGVRVAARQLVKGVAEPLGALLARNLDPEENDMPLRGRIGSFLQTQMGRQLVSMLASGSLSALPIESALKDRIARELRVSVLAEGGDFLADLVTEPLRQVLSTTLKGVLPEAGGPAELPETVAGTAGASVVSFAEALKREEETAEAPARGRGKRAG